MLSVSCTYYDAILQEKVVYKIFMAKQITSIKNQL